MKRFIINIDLPDDCDVIGVKETMQELIGDTVEEEGGTIVSVKQGTGGQRDE